MIYSTGSIYEVSGSGVKSGKGLYIFTDGSKYDGDWVDNSRDGKGKRSFINGDSYDGDWVRDGARYWYLYIR